MINILICHLFDILAQAFVERVNTLPNLEITFEAVASHFSLLIFLPAPHSNSMFCRFKVYQLCLLSLAAHQQMTDSSVPQIKHWMDTYVFAPFSSSVNTCTVMMKVYQTNGSALYHTGSFKCSAPQTAVNIKMLLF